MSKPAMTLGRNDRLRVADDLMRQERIRHLPVLDDDGQLAGIVSQRDLFRSALLRSLGFGSRAEDRMLDSLVVKEAMTNNPQTIGPEAPLPEAARMMVEHKVGCLPVVADGKLVGILTEGDFVALVARED
jgi:CBS domain-containing membrane protein